MDVDELRVGRGVLPEGGGGVGHGDAGGRAGAGEEGGVICVEGVEDGEGGEGEFEEGAEAGEEIHFGRDETADGWVWFVQMAARVERILCDGCV